MLGSLCLLLYSLCFASGCKERPFFEDAGPLVKTHSGSVVGKYIKVFDTDVAAFLGIPFATPPLGERRFGKPEPMQPWEGVVMADEKPKPCMQFTNKNFSYGWFPTTTPSEDCLYLNVWSPTRCCCDQQRKLPVLVWVYGGAFSSGSSDIDLYDGGTVASFGEVVVVSFNYRVGSFGFLYAGSDAAPGNAGMHDQVLALEWIRDNIASFGGDPDSVTLFGESAGSISISLHLISPLSRGLFRRAILQSGSGYGFPIVDDPANARLKAGAFARSTGCADEGDGEVDFPEAVRCLKGKGAVDLAKAEAALTLPNPMWFTPTSGDEFLPESPKSAYESKESAPVEVMAGLVRDEGGIFLPYMMPDVFPHDGEPSLNLELTRNVVGGLYGTLPQPVVDRLWGVYFQGISEGDSEAMVNAVRDSFGDFVFNCPVMFLAEKLDSAYLYWMTHRSLKSKAPGWVGVTHFDDVPFVFGRPIADTENFTPEDARFSGDLIQKWATFARTGNPMGENKDLWPKFNSSNPIAYELNPRDSKIVPFPRRQACEFWRAVLMASP